MAWISSINKIIGEIIINSNQLLVIDVLISVEMEFLNKNLKPKMSKRNLQRKIPTESLGDYLNERYLLTQA